MRQNLTGTLLQIASDWNLDADRLMAYASEDGIGGWTYLGYWPGGSIWDVEGRILYALVRLLAPVRVLECGTAAGCSTTHILSALWDRGAALLTSVSLEGQGERVPDELRERWTFEKGITAQAYLDENAKPFDFAFEDTDHTVPTTVEILTRLKARESIQTIISHDICHPWSGYAMQEAWTAVFGPEGGTWHAYDIEPSDCGLAMWRRS